MKALVVGGSGFVGSHVADALTEAGHDVTVADRHAGAYLREAQSFVVCDITDDAALAGIVEGHDVVYHFAGIADIAESLERPRDTALVNVAGTVNLLEASRAAGVSRFVLASSVYVGGAAGSFYRVSKQSAELYVEEYAREFGVPYTIVRFGTLYGRRAGDANSIHRYLRQALVDRRIVAYGTGEELREYIHVSDAARLCVELLSPEYENERVILTGIHPLRFRELLTLIREIVGDDVVTDLRAPDAPESAHSGHYGITPYAFRPRLARRIVPSSCVDLGEGLLDVLSEIHASPPAG